MIAISSRNCHVVKLIPRRIAHPSLSSSRTRLLVQANVVRRCFHDGGRLAPEGRTDVANTEYWKEYRDAYNVSNTSSQFDFEKIPDQLNIRTTAVGFLVGVRRLSAALLFATLRKGVGNDVQIIIRDPEMVKKISSTTLHSAVSVTGTLQLKRKPKDSVEKATKQTKTVQDVEIVADEFLCLNSYSKDIASGPEHVHPPTSRHLQIRFDDKIQAAILFRAEVLKFARNQLADFTEVETPILFKSTPEGAKEFLVPTRRPGFAYALPQSPQQYKQILMASGIQKYVQFARCFRDEDLRSDRQPEFTQIDLEMAWTDGEGVMKRVEEFIRALYQTVAHPPISLPSLNETPFYRMTYDDAMSEHGSDKPDLRIPGLIHRVDHIIPKELLGMITHLDDPIIEAYKVRLDGTPQTIQKFLQEFFKTTEGERFEKNPHGGPGISIYNPRRPLEGLQTFGFEGAEAIKDFYSSIQKKELDSQEGHEVESCLDEGDLLLLQARPNLPHSGGSTALGNLRRAIYQAAITQGLIKPDPRHLYLWVTGFPMFTLENGDDPGQGGASGFAATHHPFTAPKTAEDVDLLLTDPLQAKADHYDLVVNGVELGGGSRRIHSAEMQRFVMRDVLKMSDERISDFDHLLKALAAGCPPHAGLAIGFDRLIAVLCGTDSVRDVIAFPKNGSGVDLMVGSPSEVTLKELERYHLQRLY